MSTTNTLRSQQPKASAKNGRGLGRSVSTAAGRLVLFGGAILVVLPFVYALSTSFKAPYDVFKIPMEWIPGAIHFENYTHPFESQPIGRYFLNSAFVAALVTILNVLTCSMAGYSFAKFHYRGRSVLFLVVLSTLMVPIQVIIVPLFVLVKALGWVNTYTGLILPAGTSAFGVFLMRQYFLGIPNDFIDAARIDGSSEFGIFWRIMLPLVRPALTALTIFIFMNNWNSFLWPLLVVTKEELMTLPVGIAGFESAYSTNYGELMAVSVMAMVPVFLVFIVLQRQFIEGMALSGLKQ